MLSTGQVVYTLIALQAVLTRAASNADPFNATNFPAEDVIEADVVTVGCGASGIYAAVKLFDAGKKVKVIDQAGRCGGHVQTYFDPAGGKPIHAAVEVLANQAIVDTFFTRLGLSVETEAATLGDQMTNDFIDFKTGQPVNFTVPDVATLAVQFTEYSTILTTTYPYLAEGYDLPDPVPEELLASFGDFLQNRGLLALTFPIYLYSQQSDITKYPALYALRQFGLPWVAGVVGGFVGRDDYLEIYNRSMDIIGSDNVLLNTNIVATQRTDSGVKVIVQTGNQQKLITAKQLLMTGHPLLDNLKGWDTTQDEKSLFGKWNSLGYAGGIIHSTSLNETPSYNNISPEPPFFMPTFPALYVFGESPGHHDTFNFFFSSPEPMPLADVVTEIKAELQRLDSNNLIDASDIEFALTFDHSPYRLWVSAEEIKDGFYKKLYGLQGQLSTYWSGATFATQDHAACWRFSERIVDEMLLKLA